MDDDVERSWRRILGWVDRHCHRELSLIREGASEEQLLAVEREVGRALPDDLRAWWRLSDGTEEPGVLLLRGDWAPLPVEGALALRRVLLDIEGDVPGRAEQDGQPAGEAAGLCWLPSWLPIGRNHGGSDLFVDLREGPAYGCVCMQDKESRYSGRPEWGSVAEMLAQVEGAMADDVSIDGALPYAENGRVWWS